MSFIPPNNHRKKYKLNSKLEVEEIDKLDKLDKLPAIVSITSTSTDWRAQLRIKSQASCSALETEVNDLINNTKLLRSEFDRKIQEIQNTRIKPLNEKLDRARKTYNKLLYQERHPYIRILDSHLNYCTEIIYICLSYLPVTYCVKCDKISPRGIRADFCCLEKTLSTGYRFEYKLYGEFSVTRNENIIVQFKNENDILFLQHLSDIIRWHDKSNNRFIIDSISDDINKDHNFNATVAPAEINKRRRMINLRRGERIRYILLFQRRSNIERYAAGDVNFHITLELFEFNYGYVDFSGA